jgi:hypothetical protein
MRCLTCPSVPADQTASCSKAHLPTSAPLSRPGHQTRYPASYPGPTTWRSGHSRSRVPVGFRPPAFASWASCSRQRVPLSSRSAYRTVTQTGPDSVGVSVFRTHETRLGLGAPCTPRTVVSTRPHTILGRHLPPSNGRPLSPWHRSPPQDVQLTRHQQGFTGIHPAPSLPLACGPRTEREPLGFPVSFAPGRCWPQQSRTSRWGQVLDTDPDYVFSIG